RDHKLVYRVEAKAAGVVAAIGNDSYTFPLGENLQPDPDQASKQGPGVSVKPGDEPPVPQVADPQKVDDLRAVAGILPDGAKPGDARPDAVSMPPQQMAAFSPPYFRTLGLQTPAANEQEVQKLSETFKPATPGADGQPGHGPSDAARDMIRDARALYLRFRPIL